jgi:PhnB protein
MKIVTNLLFDGNCREAFEHYAEVLGGEIRKMIPFGEAPEEMRFAAGFDEAIMHAWLVVGDHALMGGDAPPARREPMRGFTVSLHFTEVEAARRAFEGLAEGGAVGRPFGPAFWSPGFGTAVDRFGVPWTVNCEPQAEAQA